MRLPKIWFKVIDAFEVIWTIYLGKRTQLPNLGSDSHGVTLEDSNTVEILDEGDSKRVALVAFHELMHVSLSTPGDINVFCPLLGIKEENSAEVEEKIVSFMAPRLFALLDKNGLLKFPKKPKTQL